MLASQNESQVLEQSQSHQDLQQTHSMNLRDKGMKYSSRSSKENRRKSYGNQSDESA